MEPMSKNATEMKTLKRFVLYRYLNSGRAIGRSTQTSSNAYIDTTKTFISTADAASLFSFTIRLIKLFQLNYLNIAYAKEEVNRINDDSYASIKFTLGEIYVYIKTNSINETKGIKNSFEQLFELIYPKFKAGKTSY
jgi:hypothetical protein